MYYGPKIVSDGIVLGYDTGYGVADKNNSTRFYKGKPTTNLQASGGMNGMSGISLSYVGVEDGWKKYSMNGTFNGGTYPYIMVLSGTSFTGGAKYSAQVKVKTNVPGKFNYFGSNGISYVNQPKDHEGSNSSTVLPDGSYLLQRQGFAYTSTTTQGGYLWTNPINGTTFSSSTDFLYMKDFQVEQNDYCTPYVNGTRSSTNALLDVTGGMSLNLSTVSFDSSNGQMTFDGSDDYIDIASNPSTGDSAASWEWVVKFDAVHDNETSVYRQLYIQESSVWIAQYYDYIGLDIAKDNGSWYDGNGGVNTSSQLGPVSSGTWYHGVWTFDNGNINGYLNNSLQVTKAISGMTGLKGGQTPRRFGRRSSQPLIGDMPIFKVYNKALTASEVNQNFNAYKVRFGL